MRTIGWTSLAFLLLVLHAPAQAATRHYYITAEDITWDFAPSGLNLTEGRPIPAPWGKTKWQKTRYFEYTDSTFTVRKPQPEWLGILGPIIRAEVGDEIIVEFLNRSRSTHSIHPHGVRYDKDNEGAYYVPAGRGSLVPTNGRFTYHWFADAGSGPGPWPAQFRGLVVPPSFSRTDGNKCRTHGTDHYYGEGKSETRR